MFSRSDESLYQELLSGNLAAFDALYERYERPLNRFVRRQLADAAECEDVLHETFMAIIRERRVGRTARSFKAFLFQVARNICLNRIRHGRRSESAQRAFSEVEPAQADAQPEAVLERRQASEAVKRALPQLPEGLSELYHLRAGGLSYEEVAEVLGVPVGTVKSRMHELIKRLRQEVPS